jgi:type I restriction enzyme, S subunit
MFQALRPYNDYCGTQSLWIERIPATWRMQRVKSLLTERVAKGFPDEPMLAATQSHGVIRKSDYANRTVTATKDLHLLKLVKIGDFVISLRSFQGGIERCHQRGIISPAYTVLTAREDGYRDYLTYLFKSKAFVSSLTLAVTGIREGQNIDYSRLSVNLLPVPPRDEQAAIVKYLAHANARIDSAIAAKRSLTALLEEADRAIANHFAVDPAAASGQYVPWFGAVPATWNVVPAKRLFREVDRRSSSGSEGLLSLRMREGLVDANTYAVTPIPPADLVGYKIVNPGEIVMNRMRASIGLFGVAKVRGLVSPDYSTMTVAEGVDPEFYLLLFKTSLAMSEFRKRSTGLGTGSSGFMRLYYEEFGTVPLPVPSIEEQRRIVAALTSERAKIAPIAARAQHEIRLLQEFRARLVADVVTGGLDVREVAATLPEIDPASRWGESDFGDDRGTAQSEDEIETSED